MPKSGAEHPNAKLSDADVALIRSNPEDLSDYALAEKIGCERSTVRQVRLNALRHDPDYVPKDRSSRVGRPRKDKAEAPAEEAEA